MLLLNNLLHLNEKLELLHEHKLKYSKRGQEYIRRKTKQPSTHYLVNRSTQNREGGGRRPEDPPVRGGL